MTALMLSGCALAGLIEPDEVAVMNMDGPPVTVSVNGDPVASLVCQFQDGQSNVLLRPGDTAPLLPWTLELILADGTVLENWELDQLDGRQELIVRGGGAYLKSPGPVGPVPASNPGCPEAGLEQN